MMHIGWLDFTKEDRDKVMGMMDLFREDRRAVDELGIGIVRDAFADYFFPGTSTVQTRAKYFLIIPYIINEMVTDKNSIDPSEALDDLNKREFECGRVLYNNYKKRNKNANLVGKGIIGSRSLPKEWVSRSPSSIYWNGICTFNICNYKMTVSEVLSEALHERESEEERKGLIKHNRSRLDGSDGMTDDEDAGRAELSCFFDLPRRSYDSWIDYPYKRSIELTAGEKSFLKKKIIDSVPDSLLAFILKEDVELSGINDFKKLARRLDSKDLRNRLSATQRKKIKLACDFNELVYAARTRYNAMMGIATAKKDWKDIIDHPNTYAVVDIDNIFTDKDLNLFSNRSNNKLRIFLKEFQKALIAQKEKRIDKIIVDQEVRIKTKSRAKLLNKDEYKDRTAWIGGKYLDYRLSISKKIIKDIRG